MPITKKPQQSPTRLSALDIEALVLADPASDGQGSGVATDARCASPTARESRQHLPAKWLSVRRAECVPSDGPATWSQPDEPDRALGRDALPWWVVTILFAGAAMAALYGGAWVDPFFPPDR